MRLLSLLIPLIGQGYQTPLLYRMKHYTPAASFAKVATCGFQVLPQALQAMDEQRTGNEEDLSLVDHLLAEGGANLQDSDFQYLLSEVVDGDENYSRRNALRRRMVGKELSKPDFHQSSMIISALIAPMEAAIAHFLSHTKVLHDLHLIGRAHPKVDELKQKSMQKFLHVVGGDLGLKVIDLYCKFLNGGLQEHVQMGLETSSDKLNKIWEMVVYCVSDFYRRFHLDYKTSPWSLFHWLEMDAPTFVESFGALQAKSRQRGKCVDFGVATPLLEHFSWLSADSSDDQKSAAHSEIAGLLKDVAMWTPTSSDVVEIKNGQVQWAASKRGNQNVKGVLASAEARLVQAIVKQHVWVQHEVSSTTMPPKAMSSGIMRMAGTKSSTKDSKPDALTSIHSPFPFQLCCGSEVVLYFLFPTCF